MNKKLFQWAGIDFGEYNSLCLQKSLQKLAQTADAQNMRLWGKIRGTQRDYYIAEGTSNQGIVDSEGQNIEIEPRGSEGINKFCYWASNSPVGPWTTLPDLSVEEFKVSKGVKVNFTGDLERNIVTNPFYFKKERHLLRSAIARITFSTTLVPKGVYRTVEDNANEIEENTPEEGPIPVPPTIEMAKA